MGVVAHPWGASVEHVQQHAAAAPHVGLGAERIPSRHLRGHVGLCAGEGGSCTGQHSLNDRIILHTPACFRCPCLSLVGLCPFRGDSPLKALVLPPSWSNVSERPKSQRNVCLQSADSRTLSAATKATGRVQTGRLSHLVLTIQQSRRPGCSGKHTSLLDLLSN